MTVVCNAGDVSKAIRGKKIQLEHDKDVSLEEEKRITATVMEELEQVKQVQHSS